MVREKSIKHTHRDIGRGAEIEVQGERGRK